MNRVFVAIGLSLLAGVAGVALLVFGYVVPGIIVLVISTVAALHFITLRTGGSSRSSSSGRGGFHGGATGSAGGYGAGSDDSSDGGDGGGDGGGFDGGGGGDGGGG